MTTPRPSVVIIAGPNGAGKSTIAPRVLRGSLDVREFVNADDLFLIAEGERGRPPRVLDAEQWSSIEGASDVE